MDACHSSINKHYVHLLYILTADLKNMYKKDQKGLASYYNTEKEQ